MAESVAPVAESVVLVATLHGLLSDQVINTEDKFSCDRAHLKLFSRLIIPKVNYSQCQGHWFTCFESHCMYQNCISLAILTDNHNIIILWRIIETVTKIDTFYHVV